MSGSRCALIEYFASGWLSFHCRHYWLIRCWHCFHATSISSSLFSAAEFDWLPVTGHHHDAYLLICRDKMSMTWPIFSITPGQNISWLDLLRHLHLTFYYYAIAMFHLLIDISLPSHLLLVSLHLPAEYFIIFFHWCHRPLSLHHFVSDADFRHYLIRHAWLLLHFIIIFIERGDYFDCHFSHIIISSLLHHHHHGFHVH